jgi:hypothetical protein
MNLTQIEEDITSLLPAFVGELIPPYSEEMTDDRKFQSLKKALKRSISLKNRQLSLINAYFLGQFLQLETSDRYRNKISNHYYVMAKYTYDIFEEYPDQILRTKELTVQRIRQLRRSEISHLRDVLMDFFVGTRILEGRIVTGGSDVTLTPA